MLTAKKLKPNVYELTLEGVDEKSDIETMERALTPVLKGGFGRSGRRAVQNQDLTPGGGP